MPHFNAFNAYHGLKQAMAVAGAAGTFEAGAWLQKMRKQDLKLV